MFRVKVCGVTHIDDLQLLADAGVDAVGINLVPTSPRCVSLEQADKLCCRARQLGLTSVIVVMNMAAPQLERYVEQLDPTIVQLHGHELPEMLSASLWQRPILKAISWSGRDAEAALAERWKAAGAERLAFLADAFAPGVGGGTGRVARWDLLWPRPAALTGVPLILAGGLTAHNVKEAIETTHCDGVDTASGVELSPGIKDPDKVISFAAASRRAIDRLSGLE